MRTIIKSDLTNVISQKLGISISSCEDIVNQVLESTIKLTEKGDILHIKNFGKFQVFTKKPRPARDILNNVSITIPEKTVLRFSASRTLKNYINNRLSKICENNKFNSK